MTAALIVALLAAVLALFHDVLLIAFGGILFAVLLNAGVGMMVRRIPLPRWAALLIILSIAGGAVALGLFYGGSILSSQYEALRTAIPLALQQSIRALQLGPLNAFLPSNSSDVQSIAGSAMGLVQRATGMISSTVGLVLSAGVMVFVGACIAAEPELYRRGLLALVPAGRRERAVVLFDAVGDALRAWLSARLVSMFAIAIFSGIGLTVLHIPYAVALAVLAGMLAFVPNLGPIIAGLPAVLLALAISPQRALLVIVMYWLAHTLDDFIIIPIAERRIVHLPPALTILVQIGLGSLVGILGIAFAAPLTAVAIVAVRILWVAETSPEEAHREAVRPAEAVSRAGTGDQR